MKREKDWSRVGDEEMREAWEWRLRAGTVLTWSATLGAGLAAGVALALSSWLAAGLLLALCAAATGTAIAVRAAHGSPLADWLANLDGLDDELHDRRRAYVQSLAPAAPALDALASSRAQGTLAQGSPSGEGSAA